MSERRCRLAGPHSPHYWYGLYGTDGNHYCSGRELVISWPGQCCDGYCIEAIGVHQEEQAVAERIKSEVERLLAARDATWVARVEAMVSKWEEPGADFYGPVLAAKIRQELIPKRPNTMALRYCEILRGMNPSPAVLKALDEIEAELAS